MQGNGTKSLVFDHGKITPLTLLERLHTFNKIERIRIQADKNNANHYVELVCRAIDGLKHLKSFSFSAGYKRSDKVPLLKRTSKLLQTKLGKLPSLLSLELECLDLSANMDNSCIKLSPFLQSLSLDCIIQLYHD